MTVTNVMGALAALARDGRGALVLIRSSDVLFPILHSVLRPPGHGVRVRSVGAALLGRGLHSSNF